MLSILSAFSADATAQAEIIAACCTDVKAAAAGTPGADLVEIKIKAARPAPKSDVQPPGVQLAHETENAFAWLRSQCPLNPDLEKHLIGYARLLGMK